MSLQSFFINSLVALCTVTPLFAAGCASEVPADEAAAGVETQVAEVRGGRAGVGQACNDFMGNPCARGLDCEVAPLPDGVLGIPERGGVCVKPGAKLGKSCNPFTGNPCAAGLRCKTSPLPDGVVGIPERGGVCVKATRTAAECTTDAECGASDSCRPGLCYFYCLPGDASCCAPSTCQPRPQPAPDAVCTTDADCGPSDRCKPGLCYAYCLPSDPNCCAPSTCKPR